MHNVLGLGGSQTAAGVGACPAPGAAPALRRGGRLLPGNRGVSTGNTNPGTRKPLGLSVPEVAPGWGEASPESSPDPRPLRKRMWVTAATATSCAAQPLLGIACPAQLWGRSVPYFSGIKQPSRRRLVCRGGQAGHGPQEPCPPWSLGLGVLSWAPGITHSRAVPGLGPCSSSTSGNGVCVPGSLLCASPSATWVFNREKEVIAP